MAGPKTIIVDYETFYSDEYHLNTSKKGGLSYPAYIQDSRFMVYGMAIDTGRHQDWIMAKDIPLWLESHAQDILVAHNGFFDFGVMRWHYKFSPAYMLDTLLLANHVLGSARDAGGGGNGLASLAIRLGLSSEKGKPEFKGLRTLSEPQWAALIAYAKQDAKLEREVLNILLPQMTNQDFELWLLDHTLRIYTNKPLPVDLDKIGKTKILIETRRTERVAAGKVAPSVLSSNKQFGEALAKRLKAAGTVMPMKKGAKGMIPALAKGDAAFLALAEHKCPYVQDLVRARLVERSATQALARLNTLEKHANLGIPVHLIYYGAHTGRFSAGGGFNFQNLTNPDRATDPVDREIAEAIRGSIIPSPGNVFVASDAAQIEARGLAWLAGQQDILDAFASGADLYSAFISEVLGEDIHKPTENEEHNKPDVAKHLKLMRHVGKESVLGLGYMMGVDKFLFTLRSRNRDVAKLIDAGKITEAMAEEIVKHYRSKYTEIVQFWEDITRAFHKARNGISSQVGFLEFIKVASGAVGIVLPSTRTLFYRNIRAETEEGGKPGLSFLQNRKQRIEWRHGGGQKIYGGLLAENVTQAISRDVLAEGIYSAEQAGFPVAMHVHDEIVCEVPKAQGQEALDFLNKTLSTPPIWAPGIVLGAEGKIGTSLSKKKAA